ncbi:DUF7521 family protein [Haladaptatus sp. NG-SE-30]
MTPPTFMSSTFLFAIRVVTLVLGALITLYSYRAYRRTTARSLQLMTLGFGLVTVGSALGGGLDRVVGADIDLSLSIQSLFTVLGFAVLTYSLRIPDQPTASARKE